MARDKVDYLVKKSNVMSEDPTEKFIDESYYYLAQICTIYLKMDKNHRFLSILQFFTYYAILGFHLELFVRTSFQLLSINFILFVHNTHIALLTILIMILLVETQRHRSAFLNIHRMIATDFYDYHEPELEGVSKHREDMLRQRKLLAVVPISACVAAGIVLVLANVLDRFGTFDFNKTDSLVSKDLPYGFAIYSYEIKSGPVFYLTALLQMMQAFIIASSIGAAGWMYIVLTQNIMLQLKILMGSLENLERRSKYMCARMFGNRFDESSRNAFDSKEFIFCYNKCLNKNFEHHQVILSTFSSLQELFSVVLFLSYMVGTIVIALSLLSTTSGIELPGTTMASVFLCFAEVGFMYLFSQFSQYITDLSLDLRFAMYNIKWYYCNKTTVQSVAIFQTVNLRPMTLMAGGIVPANMDTFGRVMNSAYSYYNLVNAFNITV